MIAVARISSTTGAATVENSKEFPQKIKNETVFWPSNPLLGIYPKTPKTLIRKNIYPYIHSSIIYNNQDLETA